MSVKRVHPVNYTGRTVILRDPNEKKVFISPSGIVVRVVDTGTLVYPLKIHGKIIDLYHTSNGISNLDALLALRLNKYDIAIVNPDVLEAMKRSYLFGSGELEGRVVTYYKPLREEKDWVEAIGLFY